jgi:hypothetical protein
MEQLMRRRLFPATLKRPTMAFTFNVLHQFHLHHLESKESAHDFIGALRRLTDNAFAHEVSVSQMTAALRISLLMYSPFAGSFSTVSPCHARVALPDCKQATRTCPWD